MSERLGNKVAIITGAGQGIGEAIARVFADHGAAVVVANRTAAHGERTVAAIQAAGGEARARQVDIGDPDQIGPLVEFTVAAYGGLDIVVHNAAHYPVHMIDELSRETLDRTLNVNLKPCFFLAQAAVPHMRRRGGGRLLMTSSVTGPRVAMPGTAHYAASKSGINGFIRTAALEYAKDKITVNGVEPGYILTQAMAALGDEEELKTMEKFIPLGRMGEPEDIAFAMLYLASEEGRYVTGQTIIVDGGSTLPESPLFTDAV